MAKTAQELEQEFLANIVQQTGHPLAWWMSAIESQGLSKNNEIVKWVKSVHGFNHLQATMMAGIYLNKGKPVHDPEALVEKLFEGNEAQRPIYRALKALVDGNMEGVQFVPKKTYVSIEGPRCFATARINRSNLRIGLDLGERPFDAYVQKGVGLGAMPNITHMIEVTDSAEINEQVLERLKEARAHRHA